MEVTAIRSSLRNGTVVPNAHFDRLFPTGQRFRSAGHWTPVEVALRVAALFAPAADERVLDVGSGVGKLCLVGALATSATWIGVESDPVMVDAARRGARALEIADRVEFRNGDVHSVAWSEFDAIYMFNPFAEGLLGSVATRHERFDRDVEAALRQLAATRPGTRLVTYHGFGGVPEGFQLAHRETMNGGALCLSIRT
jgi:SAM-dependent methyltransferase